MTINWKYDNDVTICWHGAIIYFFCKVLGFLLLSLVTGPSFMSISLLVLKLWQFLFVWGWQEIRKSEIPSPDFCSVSGGWVELGIPTFPLMSLRLLNAPKCQEYSVSELLRENQQGELGNIDMFSRRYFQMAISLTIIGTITSTTLKFMKNERHKVIRKTIFKTIFKCFLQFCPSLKE